MTEVLLTGCGVGLGSVDFTCRCVIMAWRRSLSFVNFNEEIEGKRKMIKTFLHFHLK